MYYLLLEIRFKIHFIVYILNKNVDTRCLSPEWSITYSSSAEVVSSILVKNRIFILACLAENVRTQMIKIQPLVDKL